ncbi:MAG: MFS transporter [Saprospiraceae bacterium]|nr:MFS transporter [Saprospiraceae bacterium]
MNQAPTHQLNDKRVVSGWTFFDWANSAFALVITVAIFPIYFIGITDDYISIFNYEVSNSALYAFMLSLSYLIMAAFSPLLSGIADYGKKKKFFMKGFTILGGLACLSLFFFTGMENLLLGSIGFMLGIIGFGGGYVFYNSYLPEIVTEDRYDVVSARGFAMGFIGSVILLLLCLAVIQNPGTFGFAADSSIPVRLSFVFVGLWWLGFSIIPFRRLPKDQGGVPLKALRKKGAEELRKVWRSLKHQRNTKKFLISFFCYSAGVQTVLYLASTFAEKELKFATSELILIILILQIVAIIGAYVFAGVSKLKGNKFSLMTMLLIWVGICVYGYFIESQFQFYIVASSVGVVMGGTQSLSRSTYSKIIPEGTVDTTSYFSFYDVLEKTATVFGTFSFAAIEQITGDMRTGVLLMALFFILGLIILVGVQIKHAKNGVITH